MHAPCNFEVETLLVESGGLVDKLGVDLDAVDESAMQALEGVQMRLQTREKITYFPVAAGASLGEVSDAACHA